jgi:hypothetical protein
MKITKSKLKKIIREELERALEEDAVLSEDEEDEEYNPEEADKRRKEREEAREKLDTEPLKDTGHKSHPISPS